MNDFFEEYGSVIVAVIVAAIIIGVIVLFISNSGAISSLAERYAETIGG